MSAGEFFDLVRPVFLVVSAFLSTWVLSNSFRNGFRWYSSLAWSLATLFHPLVVLPLYCFARIIRARKQDAGMGLTPIVIVLYFFIIVGIMALWESRDRASVDAKLARAMQARVAGNTANAIKEYRGALKLEDNAHTHKLLAIQLKDAGELTDALLEFRLAEKGGEPDNTLPFQIAEVLNQLNRHPEAIAEYERFLASEACTREPVDDRCSVARRRTEK
jgi:tetratricopeptide (TPR) repeat protein